MPLPLCHVPLTAMCYFSTTYLRLPCCHSQINYRRATATMQLLLPTHLRMLSYTLHQHTCQSNSSTALTNILETATAPLTQNYRRATITRQLLPLTRLPQPSCHSSHQNACHCYPASVLINTLAIANQPLPSPKHLSLLPCNCSLQYTYHCLPATVSTNPLETATLQLLPPIHLPLWPSHGSNQQTCHCHPATAEILTVTDFTTISLATAT